VVIPDMRETARFPTSGIPLQAPRSFGVAPSFLGSYAPTGQSGSAEAVMA
jgi:hypothetical protein